VDFSPSFIWLLRDFQLRLEANGKPISPAEYLEEALLPIKATGAADIANKNQVGLPGCPSTPVCQGRVCSWSTASWRLVVMRSAPRLPPCAACSLLRLSPGGSVLGRL
jgi:hypothetical protein